MQALNNITRKKEYSFKNQKCCTTETNRTFTNSCQQETLTKSICPFNFIFCHLFRTNSLLEQPRRHTLGTLKRKAKST